MIRVRIAPSPTGENIHIGNLYAAYFNYIFAKKNNGKFIVRIEDTDRTRLVEGSEERILESLEKFNIIPDESPKIGGEYAPYRQSERLPIYKKYAEELVEKGHAYYCFCDKERLDSVRKMQYASKQIPKYDKSCLVNVSLEDAKKRIANGEQYVIRLNVPEDRNIIFTDLIRGEISINTKDVDDQVLLKSDGYPTYHLGVVVDDYLMKISHVIRAEEWISSTPKHILLYEFLGFDLPIFCHLPILRNPDRSKLAKRKNPVWANWYLEQGYLPEAVLNYLSLMGWSHPEQKEIFDREEFIKVFDLKDLKAVGPAFDVVKLEWMNGEYVRKMKMEELKDKILTFYKDKKLDEELVEKTIPIIQTRIKKLSDYYSLCYFFFEDVEIFEISLKDKTDVLEMISNDLKNISDWNAKNIGDTLMDTCKKSGLKTTDFFAILRVAITGRKISPPLNESMEILGITKCLKNITNSIK
jgi:glutamyl-tRNA synthetase